MLPSRRTIKQILDAASEEEEQAQKREKQEAAARRIQELEALAKREGEVWDEVELLVQKPQAQTYDQAVKLLVQLRDLAAHQNRDGAFQERVARIYERYSRRKGLIERMRKAML